MCATSAIFGVSERVTLPVSVDDAYYYVILKIGSKSSFANIPPCKSSARTSVLCNLALCGEAGQRISISAKEPQSTMGSQSTQNSFKITEDKIIACTVQYKIQC